MAKKKDEIIEALGRLSTTIEELKAEIKTLRAVTVKFVPAVIVANPSDANRPLNPDRSAVDLNYTHIQSRSGTLL